MYMVEEIENSVIRLLDDKNEAELNVNKYEEMWISEK